MSPFIQWQSQSATLKRLFVCEMKEGGIAPRPRKKTMRAVTIADMEAAGWTRKGDNPTIPTTVLQRINDALDAAGGPPRADENEPGIVRRIAVLGLELRAAIDRADKAEHRADKGDEERLDVHGALDALLIPRNASNDSPVLTPGGRVRWFAENILRDMHERANRAEAKAKELDCEMKARVEKANHAVEELNRELDNLGAPRHETPLAVGLVTDPAHRIRLFIRQRSAKGRETITLAERERDAAIDRANAAESTLLTVARALGMTYQTDGQPERPAPLEDIVAAIQERGEELDRLREEREAPLRGLTDVDLH